MRPETKARAFSDQAVAQGVELPVEDGAPKWVHLLPPGRFQGRDGRGPYRMSDPEAVIEASRALQMDLPIDYDHAFDYLPQGSSKPAAGWITELQSRSDGIWGRVRWTRKAAAAIGEREYRYLSPLFRIDRTGEVLRIDRAGLTNTPNLVLQAVANQQQGGKGMEFLQRLISIFGLDEEADEAAVVAAAETLHQRAEDGERKFATVAQAVELKKDASPEEVIGAMESRPLPEKTDSKFVPVDRYEELSKEFASFKAGVLGERAESQVDEAVEAGKIQPSQREWALEYAQKDPDGFTAFLSQQPVLTAASQLGKSPDGESHDPERSPIAEMFGNSAEDLKKYAGAQN